MTTATKVHRASAQRRRASLLSAAADLSAELGAGSVTHRAVAARAGVPLSTTSYFFESITDLVAEALAEAAACRVTDFDDAERMALLGEGPLRERLDAMAAEMLSTSRTTQAGIIEYYLAVGRDERLQGDAAAMLDRLRERVGTHLARAGAPQAERAAGAAVALVDGATVHHLAGVESGVEATAEGLRLLLAAAMLTDAEIDALLTRYDTAPAAGPDAAPTPDTVDA